MQAIVQKLTDKIMAFDYDIKKDLRYKQGKKAYQTEIIINMLRSNRYSLEEIAEITKLKIEEILKIKKSLEQEK
jgi:hypothetical protein